MVAKLGEYCVGGLRFVNKYDALVLATQTNQPVTWDFNDAVFSCFDWSIPIDESVDDLYRQRAQQLRDSYDYVSLFFSGGVDSTNVLHAFIDNNIHLDEIVMFKPRCHVHNPQAVKPADNLYSELEFAALPHLRKYVGGKNIKVRTIYLEDALDALLRNSGYAAQFYKLNFLTPTSVARVAMAVTDPDWSALYDAGKRVAHIQGIDRPIVKKQGNSFSFAFQDWVTTFVFESAESTETSEKLKKYQHHEFFYWTPDMPKLVIKQTQIAKKVATENKATPDVAMYLYPPHVMDIRNLFNTGKPALGVNGVQHQWIHSPEITYAKGVFVDMLTLARTKIGSAFTMNDPSLKASRPKVGFYKTIESKEYKV